ncbi:MAG: PAS domain S-box protein, partial [Methanoregula sp.]|nr:PAS domain S-box protein [Methanoregula sp.]
RREARLRAVVEDQTEFICRFTLDGRLTFVNDAYLRYFGLDRTQCLAHPHLVVLPPEDARLMKHHLDSLTPQNPVASIEHRIIMPSGEVRWQRWSDRAIFGENGMVIEYQSVGRDITETKIIELALHESEERFRQIAESAGEWIWEVDADGMYTYSNTTVYTILGYTPEEIIKRMHFYDLFVPEDRDQLKESAFRAFANREPFKGFVNATLHKNGDRVILETSGLPILDAGGTLIGYRGTDIDITARKNAEETLKERERELSGIINFLPDATLVIDKNGTVLAWNHAMEELTDVPAGLMIGKANYEYALPFYHERHPITADLILHKDPAVAAKYTVIKKEGGCLFSEIFIPHLNKGRGAYLWLMASPLYDAAGNISGAVESIRDITDRKRAEEALRESEERYHNVIEDQTEFICRFTPDGRLTFVNDAYLRYFNRKREDMVGHRFTPAIHPEDQGIIAQHLAALTPEYPVGDIDQRIIMPSGEVRWQRWSDRAIFGENGMVIEYQSVGRDITDQKRAELALRQANKQLNLLTSITRHDIKNQVLALRGYIELSRDEQDKETLARFLECEDLAAKTIEEQITFTKDYQEMGAEVPAWQNVNQCIRNTMAALPMRAVHVEPDPDDPEVCADPLFERVFYNLFDNALRYGGDQMNTIRIFSQESERGRIIVCEDDGVGISYEDKKKLFRKGFGRHTGLGLFLSREILAISGITITETGMPGKGARFEITVPKGLYRCSGTGNDTPKK